MTEEVAAGTEPQTEGVAGVGMMLAGYVDELAAEQAYESLKQAKREGSFYYDDAAVIRQDPHGKVHIKESGDMSTGKGAGIGALVGGVIGLLAGPAGVALGAAGGAAFGGLAAHHDAGFDNKSLKEIGGALLPGTSALAATTSKDFVEEIRKQAPKEGRLTSAQELAAVVRESLETRNDVLLGLVITEEGVAATKVISSPTAVAVFGIGVTEDGVVAGRAVATAEGAAYEVGAATEDEAAYEAGVVTDEGAVIVDAVEVPVEEEETGEDPKE